MSQIVWKAVYFLPKKCGFDKGASFILKITISSVNYLLQLVFIYLNKT